MCRFLHIPRSLVYYIKRTRKKNTKLENEVIRIFRESRNNYGTRKIKVELRHVNLHVSRRQIGAIMQKYALVSNYTIKHYKIHKVTCNNDIVPNIVDRNFNNREDLEVIVSDLTYVKVMNKWHYICLIINLYNREIMGFSSGKYKTAQLVYEAFLNSTLQLSKVKIFHTDRGNEFKNKLINELLTVFNIKRSLSHKGCPFDNAVAEATYKIIKTEFAFNKIFGTQEELNRELFDYVNWYNTKRIHGTLGYVAPRNYKPEMTECFL